MMLPPKTDPRWTMLVRGEIQRDFKNLAVKILISKLKVENIYGKSEQTLQSTISQAYEFFSKNIDTAKEDIQTIFGQGTLR